ncbi:MAG: hypothetical protein LBC19_06415 [Tannerella sp.]|jgi:hypothetical protein|nr:hypothetical protein [Tannerella sp.]
MKGGRIYMISLGVCFVFVFLFEYMSPHEFIWTPTFDKNDKEPFGSYVFDDVVSSSVNNYTVTDKTFYRIMQEADSITPPRAFLITENKINFNETDIEYLYRLIHAGNRIMICSNSFSHALEDTLGFKIEYDGFLPNIKRYITDVSKQRDSIYSAAADTLNSPHVYSVYPQMHPVYINGDRHKHFLNCDSSETLVWNEENKPLAVRAFIGKGELFIVSTPLMFTNYGVLDGNNASYTFRLLSYMKDRPLVRTEAYGRHDGKPGSPLRYVLSEPPLRWATYSILSLLVLFMIFTAKRRQRVIPIVKTPPNRTFGFMQLISNLYYQKHDNRELLKLKHMYFCAEVKRRTGTDLQYEAPGEATYTRLSEKTGINNDILRTLINNINRGLCSSGLHDLELKQCIDGMNDILQTLKT